MTASVFRTEVPVERPFDLYLTTLALQRLSTNAVDVLSGDGTYRRALQDHQRTLLLRVRQLGPEKIAVELAGTRSDRLVSVAQRMLGTDVDLRPWGRRVAAIPWLRDLSRLHRGLHPPRYPTLWEAVAHAIVFQQISIHAAGAIMQRFVMRFSAPIEDGDIVLYPFPAVNVIADAHLSSLRSVGLSANKAQALQECAIAFAREQVKEKSFARLASAEAIAALSALRGIGPWSAAVILLRGLGRLDVFPLNDSGVAASLKLLSGRTTVNLDRLLLQLGDQRGMLYF
ncbi:MAG: DNA-3-methyladenine glycosylase 2 family protein, partial [Candidatus Eremiobacteraeota bacterium]|nr:DNA-3-methyladenine glycosylase 2 family protein [Candidatus Eremiobacteraeota bacterium]